MADVFNKLTKLILTKVENNDLKPKAKESIIIPGVTKTPDNPNSTGEETDNSWSSYCQC